MVRHFLSGVDLLLQKWLLYVMNAEHLLSLTTNERKEWEETKLFVPLHNGFQPYFCHLSVHCAYRGLNSKIFYALKLRQNYRKKLTKYISVSLHIHAYKCNARKRNSIPINALWFREIIFGADKSVKFKCLLREINDIFVIKSFNFRFSPVSKPNVLAITFCEQWNNSRLFIFVRITRLVSCVNTTIHFVCCNIGYVSFIIYHLPFMDKVKCS